LNGGTPVSISKSGTLLRQVINKINEAIDFNDSQNPSQDRPQRWLVEPLWGAAYIQKPLHPAMIDLCHALGRDIPWIHRW